MKHEKLFEIRAFDFEAEEMTSVWYTGDYSLLDLHKVLGEENMELNEEQTLQLYLDHDWIDRHWVLIVNDIEIMDTPLKVLLHDYYIYDLVHEKEMEFIRG